MAAYPEWVKQYRERGTTVKRVGSSYYLYKTKSVRKPGKKYPQPQSEYIGRITQQGVIKSNVKKLETSVVRVYEYGFSFALKTIMPEKLTKDIGDDKRAEGIALHLIRRYSPTSYLLRDVDLPTTEELHVNLSVHEKKFERLTGIEIENLLPLQQVFLVEIDGKEMISEVTLENEKSLKEVGVAI